jgi:hypothetical protein
VGFPPRIIFIGIEHAISIIGGITDVNIINPSGSWFILVGAENPPALAGG